MSRNGFLFAAIVVILGAFFWKYNVIKSNIVPPDREILTNLENDLKINSPILGYNYVDWVNEDGIRLPLTGKNFWTGTSNIENATESAKLQDDIMLINSEFLNSYKSGAEAFFKQNGFMQNPQNTFNSHKDTISQERIAFEKRNTKCVVILYQTTDPFGNFFCGQIDHDQIKLQKPFIPIFGNTYRQTDPVTFRVDKIEGNFAVGSASDEILGYTWIGEKTNGTWEIIWKASEIGLCADFEKLGIPKSIYQSCYTPN